MNIHIIPNDKFAIKFIDFIDTNFNKSDHFFYIYGDPFFKIDDDTNVKNIKCFEEIDFSKSKGTEKIFIHSFYDTHLIRFLFKNYFKLNKNQIVYIIYGFELYNARFELEKNKFNFKLRVFELLKRIILKKSNRFMTFAAPDYELLHKWYGATGKQFDCLYPSNINKNYLDKIKGKNEKKTNIRVILGNSATSTNKHLDALEMLKKYRNEKIEIVCPLSYGSYDDQNYRYQVAEKGKEYFGDRFIPIFDYMDIEKYCDLLNSADIAVFNNNRQQATANIEILGYLGKKIYVRSDTTTWGHYVKRDNCRFFDTKKIENMPFEEFISNKSEDAYANAKYFTKIWDINYVKSLWEDVINS